VAKVETLEEIFSEADETSENSIKDCPETMNQAEQKSWNVIFGYGDPMMG
jgi:hypothetical protein